jgi:murein DD-endopeptidase MepM/ murein hydrolase activator NlpD
MRLLPAAICLLPNLLFAAAQSASPPVATSSQSQDTYIVQAGDTLVGIARRHGLTPDALAKANALDRPDKIIVGNVLRLPVTPPTPPQHPAAAPAAAVESVPAQLPTAAKSQDQEASPQPTPAPLAPKGPKTPPAPAAPALATPAKAQPPQDIPAQPHAKIADVPDAIERLAVGTYANPTLGVLRVTQTPTGIAVSRDNRTIAMRHLLYGVFDGTDATGDIQGLRLQFDDDGQVRALLYSSSSGKDIPFTRMKK